MLDYILAILLFVRESWLSRGSYRPSWNTWCQSEIRLSYIDKMRRFDRMPDKWPLGPKSQIRH